MSTATLEARPPSKWHAGSRVRNSKGQEVFVFSVEWGPDNRFVRGTGWAYEVCREGDSANRSTISEEKLEAFAAS